MNSLSVSAERPAIPAGIRAVFIFVCCLLLITGVHAATSIQSPGSAGLAVSCSASPAQMTSGQQGQLSVAVTYNGNPVQGAQVTVSSSFLQISPATGTTDSSGVFRSVINAPSGLAGTDRVTANAVYVVPSLKSLQPALTSSGSVEVLVSLPAPPAPPPQPPQPPQPPIQPVVAPSGISPVVVATASPRSGTTPLTVTFDASGSYDPDGSIVRYSWNFADGTTGTGAVVAHTYQKAGVYRALVTATDTTGLTATSALLEISVQSPVTRFPGTNITKSVTGKTSEESLVIRGDLDQDSFITSADALAILKMAAGRTQPDFTGDVNNDNQITTDDARMILRESLDSNLPASENIAVVRRDLIDAIGSTDAGYLLIQANKRYAGSDAPAIHGMVSEERDRNPLVRFRSGLLDPDSFNAEIRTSPRVVASGSGSMIGRQATDTATGKAPRVLETVKCDQIAAAANKPRITSVGHYAEATRLTIGSGSKPPSGTASWSSGTTQAIPQGTGSWISGTPNQGPLLTSSVVYEPVLSSAPGVVTASYTFSEGDLLEVSGDWFGCYAGTEKVCQDFGSRCNVLQRHDATLEMQYQPRSEFDPVRTVEFRLEPGGGSWEKAWSNNSILLKIPEVIEDPALITALEDESKFRSRIRLDSSENAAFPAYSGYFNVIIGSPSISQVYSKATFTSPTMAENLSTVVSGQPVIITGQNFGSSRNGKYGEARVELVLDRGAFDVENYEYEKWASIKGYNQQTRTFGLNDVPVSDLSSGSGWYYYKRITTKTRHSSQIALDIISWNDTVIIAQAEQIKGNYVASEAKISVFNPNRKVPSLGTPVTFLPKMVAQQITGEMFYRFNKEKKGDHYEIIEGKDAKGAPIRLLHAVHVTGGCPGKDGDDTFFEFSENYLPPNVAITAEILHRHTPGQKDFWDYLKLMGSAASAIYQASEGSFGPLVNFACDFTDYPEICSAAGNAVIECVTMNWVSCAFNLGKLAFHVLLQIFSDFAGEWWLKISKCTGDITGIGQCEYDPQKALDHFYIWIDWNTSCTGKNKNEPCIYEAAFYVVAPDGVNLGR